MNVTTLASRTATAAVAGVAGYASFHHIVSVALGAGESSGVAHVLPAAIDGLIVVGTLAMIEDKRTGRIPRMSARFALGFGVVATLAANIASAQPSVEARLVAAVPAVAFLIAVEVLSRSGKPAYPSGSAASADPQEDAPEPMQMHTPAASPVATPPVAPATPVQTPPASSDAPVQTPDDSAPRRATGGRSAAPRITAYRRRHPDATQAQVARALDITEKTAHRHWSNTVPVQTVKQDRDGAHLVHESDLAPADVQTVNGTSVPTLVTRS